MVPVARAHGRRHRPHDRGGERILRDCGASAIALSGGTLDSLRGLLVREGEAIGPVVTDRGGDEVLAPLVRACARGRPDGRRRDGEELALVLESILEGYLLHYDRPRLIDTPDEDLRLLAGDHLYALGLSRLAQLGDLDAVRALADLISLSARARAEAAADPASGAGPAALWLLTALAVAGGRWPGYEQALASAHAGRVANDDAIAAVRTRAAALGIALEAEAALIAFRNAVVNRPYA